MADILQGLLGQCVALLTFFGFPVIQHAWLRRLSSRDGVANLSFSPRYGLRVAIVNQFGKRVLSDIRWRVLVRSARYRADGRSPGVCDDVILLTREDFFLFPGADQILFAFKLRRTQEGLQLVPVSVTGTEREPLNLDGAAVLICDFAANIEMRFNFDIRIAKRLKVDFGALALECSESQDGYLVPIDWRRLNYPSVFEALNVD